MRRPSSTLIIKFVLNRQIKGLAMATTPSKVPEWLQSDLFLDVLQSNVKGFSKIKSFNIKSGSVAGDNYATIMLRVNIEVELEDGQEKSVSYMLKLPHQLDNPQRMAMQSKIFETERIMYNLVVPEMETLYWDAGVDLVFGAKSYELKGAKSDYILLDDLTTKGFRNINRLEGLDQVHTEAALQKLSQWHAASAVGVAKRGPYPDNIMIGFYKEENRLLWNELIKSAAPAFVKCCATYEGNEVYIEKVKALHPKIVDKVFNMDKSDPNEFNALNHGDFWCNNMMFSHDAFGNIKEIHLIDFQTPTFGSVAQDLYYCLLTSTKFDDKLTKFDYYIKFYHANLVQNLKLLSYPKTLPSLRDLHLSLFKKGLWGYIISIGPMTGVLVDPTEAANLDNILSDSAEGNDFKNLLYSNSRYRKHIQAILPWLLNRGALES